MDAAEGISDALENALLPCLALLTYFLLSLCLSIQTTVLCASFHSFLRLFQGSPKAKVLKEERREKSGERERDRELLSEDAVTA